MIQSRFLPGGAVELRVGPQHPAYIALAGMLGQAYRDHAQGCQQQAIAMSAAKPPAEAPAGDPYKELAAFYAATWSELARQGEEIPDAELQAARDELADGNWVVEFRDGKWIARPAANDDDPIQMSQKRSPKGGVTVAGKFFRGGLWIPADALAKATPEQLKEIDDANEGIRQRQRGKREARGPIDTDSLRSKLQPHADAANLHAKENRPHLTSAKLMYHALAREHGDLTAHRIDELAEQAERALSELPEEDTGKREYFGRQLAKLHHALGMAKERAPTPQPKTKPMPAAAQETKAGVADHAATLQSHAAKVGTPGFSYDALKADVTKAGKELDAAGVGTLAKDLGFAGGTRFKSKTEALDKIYLKIAEKQANHERLKAIGKPRSRDAITNELQQAYDDDRAGTRTMPTPADYADVKVKPADIAAVRDSVAALATGRDATDLAAVYQHAKQASPDLTDDQFKAIVGKLTHDKAIQLEPYTRAIATVPHPEHVLPLSGELMYYVRPSEAAES